MRNHISAVIGKLGVTHRVRGREDRLGQRLDLTPYPATART